MGGQPSATGHISGAITIEFNSLFQWTAIIIELIGLVLVSVELYFPKVSEFLKATFEETKPKFMKNKLAWLGCFIVIWIVAVFVLSAWNTSMLLISNLFFSAITAIVLIIFTISKLLVRLGVVLGRGNSVGGVGLVLALIGFSLELIQLA
ncbi:hypothetical protein [Alteromonas halophila]|uniref:Uncharacterized protein n=1 Tax=Alteromonas halophila TaxID=516698 RepID=A0A918JEK0_9ALTE|nr:hypothetical protein [Alteromonas halophila]GGW76369.1 hypothetical protein GCM10007391_06220 [Alteromonas halophila]